MRLTNQGIYESIGWTPERVAEYETIRYSLDMSLNYYEIRERTSKQDAVRMWTEGKLRIVQTEEDLKSISKDASKEYLV